LPTNPMQTLSGGQRVRVALATAFIRPPHILILDEVTNHLDIETIQVRYGLRKAKYLLAL
ncbi:hypothetical protein SARC_15681, partial [Sphaeroforma arctica JP610]